MGLRHRRRRRHAQIAADACSWALALSVASVLRYEFQFHRIPWQGLALLAAVIVVFVQWPLGWYSQLYRGRWLVASFDQMAGLIIITVTGTAVSAGLVVASRQTPVPDSSVALSVALSGGVGALVLMSCSRYLWRLMEENKQRPSESKSRRVVVYGAGVDGQTIVRQLLRDPESDYLPVALLDDDPTKRNLSIMGVPVVGNGDALVNVARQHDASMVVVALPTAGSALIRSVVDRAAPHDITVKVIPSIHEVLRGQARAGDLRAPSDADLLGRHRIETDVDAIADYLRERRVLVTGAGGSIGSELCAQIIRYGPSSLIMLDRDESALHALKLAIEGRALLDTSDLVLVDIRDRIQMASLMKHLRPDVVFHAAALKHLALLERHPVEALKSNVWGSLSVLEAARDAGVERFVNVSTDKAADPISVLGYSKRLAEGLTADLAADSPGTFLSVRFGNVLGSRGSVLTAFRSQIERGGPVTVTDPAVTRYFMTVGEAVELMIQAGTIGRSGEALVLDMGVPVSIDALACQLIKQSGRDIEIVYTGLRPGEKLHEDLLATGEADVRPIHPLISHVPVPPLPRDEVREIDPLVTPAEMVDQLATLCQRMQMGLQHS